MHEAEKLSLDQIEAFLRGGRDDLPAPRIQDTLVAENAGSGNSVRYPRDRAGRSETAATRTATLLTGFSLLRLTSWI